MTDTDITVTNTVTNTLTTTVIVFGAGGRAGRAAVAEAVARGHRVTAVVRDPAKHADLAATGAAVVAGDVTDAGGVAALAAGHTAAISAAFDPAAGTADFFAAAADALSRGLAEAGVRRLVAVGVGTTLETAPGTAVHDAEDFPAEYRAFSLGHAAEIPVLAASGLDWLVLAPPPVVLTDAPRTGVYRLGDTRVLPDADTFSYADLAVALVAEAVAPTRARELVAVG